MVAIRPPELLYAVDERPPAGRLTVLGLQYAFLIGIYLIMVVIVARAAKASPEVTASLVSLGFIAVAVGALAQCYNGALFGSGYLAPPGFTAIYIGPALIAARHGGLPAVAGLTIFAGLVEAVLSRLLLRLRVVFQPAISGFTVFVVGLQLGIVGIAQTLDMAEEGRPVYTAHLSVALITLAVAIGFTIWGRGVLHLICTLLGVVAGVVAGIATGLIGPATFASIAAAPWLALPDPSFLSYRVEAPLLPAFIAAGFAATLRVIGVITICQKINDAGWQRPDLADIKKGVLADGMGTITAGMLGCPGTCVMPSLVGVSSATGATSRVIGYAAAALLLAFAFLPKVSAAIVGLPMEIAGAVLVFSASFMITSGLGIMLSRTLDTRASFALSISVLLGLATQVHPGFFSALPEPWGRIAGDMLTVSLASAIALTLLFRIGIHRKESVARQTSDDTVAEFSSFFDKDGKRWKLDPRLVDRVKTEVAEVVEHLKDAYLLDTPVAISADYDTIDVLIEIHYRGRPPVLAKPANGHETAHEEAAVTAGLTNFAGGQGADRIGIASKGDEVVVRLWFGV